MRLGVFINGFAAKDAGRSRAMRECLESARLALGAGDVVAALVAEGAAAPEVPAGVLVLRVAVKPAPEAGGRPLPYLRDLLDAGAAVLDVDVFCYLNSDLLMDAGDAALLKSGAAKAYVLKSHEIDACSLENFRVRRFKIDVAPRPGFDAVAFERAWWREGGRAHFPAGFILGEWRWDTAYDAIVRTLPPGVGLSASGTYHRRHASAWRAGSAGGRHNDALLRSLGPKLMAVAPSAAATSRTREDTGREALPEVIVSGAADMMPAWCGAWERSGNRNPVRFFADRTWGAEARAACGRVGTVEDAEEIYKPIRARMKGRAEFKIGWMAKAEIMRRARGEWAVWIDHDVEVQGDIGPMVDYAMKNAEWFASPVYASFCQEDLTEHVAQHGIIVYKPGCEKMAKWCEYVAGQGDPNDEHTFMRCFGGYEAAKKEVLDLYRPEWYESLQTGAMPIRPEAVVARLQNSRSTLVHWTSRELKAPMLEHLRREGRGTLPRTPCGEVDAVYVLGTGSRSGNEELRLSLRSLAANCPWVRKAWVVGADPGFLSPEVGYIPAGDPYTHNKDANIVAKALAAAEHPGVAEKFLLCSDDQLVTRPCGPEDFEMRWLKVYSADDPWYSRGENAAWRKRLKKTLERFGDGAKYYQPHIWTPMEKTKVREMCRGVDLATAQDVTIFSWYGNFVNAGGRENFDHAFAHGAAVPQGALHLAYSDAAWAHKSFRNALRAMFPVPCRFELRGADPANQDGRGKAPEGGDALKRWLDCGNNCGNNARVG